MQPQRQRSPGKSPNVDARAAAVSSAAPEYRAPALELTSQGPASTKDFFADLQARSQRLCSGCGHRFIQHTVNRLGQTVCMAWQPQLEKFCECDDFAWARLRSSAWYSRRSLERADAFQNIRVSMRSADSALHLHT